MPRRHSVAGDAESQKENQALGMTAHDIKAEKAQRKGKAVKEEKAKLSARQRVPGNDEQPHPETHHSQTSGQDEEEGGEEEQEEVDDDGGSPRGNKRARVNEDGDSTPVKAEMRVKTMPRDPADGFIPGSIVRVQLRNFVTYDDVEFRPGPHLNMILGPNGTGKSSIACALALGLNFPASVLGRATEISAYVKHETQNGHIEIELKGPPNEPNLVIRREIQRNNKANSFKLNGRAASGKEISEQMARLNVQVGNLCSFLPQDKVSEFAQMSPQLLLRETERSAGNPNLLQWHDTLIASGKELKELKERMDGEAKHRDQMKTRNENMKKEVEKFKERQQIEADIDLFKVFLEVQIYVEARADYRKLKAEQRRLHQLAKSLMEKNQPAHDYKQYLTEQLESLNQEREDKKKDIKTKSANMERKWKASNNHEEEADKIFAQLSQIRKAEKAQLEDIKKQERELERMIKEFEKPLETEDEDAINAKLRDIIAQKQSQRPRTNQLEDRQTANARADSDAKREVQRAEQMLRAVNDSEVQRFNSLRQWNPDCAEAVNWVRQNKDKFRHPVMEPACLSCTVTDPKYLDAVETCFGASNMLTLVALCQEDYNTLNHYLNDIKVNGRNIRVSTWYRQETHQMSVPYDQTELRERGFDGYALDFIECPEELKSYLRMEMGLHRIPVGLNENRIDVGKIMAEIVHRGGSAKFIAGRTMNSVNRSNYGSRAVQNASSSLRQARNLKKTAVDADKAAAARANLDAAMANVNQLKAEAEELGREEVELNKEKKELVKQETELKRRLKVIADVQAKKLTLENKIAATKRRIKDLKNAPSPEVREQAEKKRLQDITKKRVQLAKDYVGLARGLMTDYAHATRIALECMQITSNVEALNALLEEKDAVRQKALADFLAVDEKFKVAKARATELAVASKELVDSSPEDLRERYKRIELLRNTWNGEGEQPDDYFPAMTSDKFREELGTLEIRLEQNRASNPGILEQYERREKEIEDLDRTLATRQQRATKLERVIKLAMGNWKPALESLVGSIGKKFSAAFDSIGCAGEIRIHEHEDFDKWAIDIMVKFRDSEKLQLLTGQRQSGGERSLTTIMYLMSLTAEARAPFSLVDEINQGMDQRAERAVHNSMVDVTCQADSAQYFLITPKLLPDLKYHEQMKVLCVNNGEWLPDDHEGGNMMSMLNRIIATRQRGTSSA